MSRLTIILLILISWLDGFSQDDFLGSFQISDSSKLENLWFLVTLNEMDKEVASNYYCDFYLINQKEIEVKLRVDETIVDSIVIKYKRKNDWFKLKTKISTKIYVIINGLGFVKRRIRFNNTNIEFEKKDLGYGLLVIIPVFTSTMNYRYNFQARPKHVAK
jgi:hypothetical protein